MLDIHLIDSFFLFISKAFLEYLRHFPMKERNQININCRYIERKKNEDYHNFNFLKKISFFNSFPARVSNLHLVMNTKKL